MSTYRELVYMVLDQLKMLSDDNYYTEQHVVFLLDKYRSFLIQKEYLKNSNTVPSSSKQTICLNVNPESAFEGSPCIGVQYLKSTIKIPDFVSGTSPQIYPIDYYQSNIVFISKDRMKYVGHNKYLQNMIYCSIGPDNYLYLKSYNPQFQYLQQVKLTGVFEDASKAAELSCDSTDNNKCADYLDNIFPLEEALIPALLELVVKTLTQAVFKPADEQNDARDNMSNLALFMQKNTKSDLLKAIE